MNDEHGLQAFRPGDCVQADDGGLDRVQGFSGRHEMLQSKRLLAAKAVAANNYTVKPSNGETLKEQIVAVLSSDTQGASISL